MIILKRYRKNFLIDQRLIFDRKGPLLIDQFYHNSVTFTPSFLTIFYT
jgi:hypothetical protein